MQPLAQALRAKPALAILRGAFTWDEIVTITEALIEHRLPAIEYTWNSPNAESVVAGLNRTYGQRILVGAGTILSPEQARQAVRAGASFLVTPNWSTEVSDEARQLGVQLLPGVFTPTEVAAASAAGWPVLKLFPGGTGGPGHLRALKGPFDDVDFVVTGGVSTENCGTYLEAGALAVAIGSSVFKPGTSGAQVKREVTRLSEALEGVRKPT